MRFRDFLKMEAVRLGLSCDSKNKAIEQLVDVLVTAHQLTERQDILKSVLDREALMSTAVGRGVAIPHGKVDAVQSVMASMAILQPPIEFNAPDELPVQIVILLVASLGETGPHIRALAHISRVLQDDEVRAQLIHAKSAKDVFDILEKKEKSL